MQIGGTATKMFRFVILFVLFGHVVDAQKTLTRCEWGFSKSMTLSCQGNDVIQITRALYGRKSRVICPWSLHWGVTDCEATSSLDIARKICDGERTCTLKASNDMFGDPCEGVAKYLKVRYQCKGTETKPPNPRPPQGVCGKPDIQGTRVIAGKDAVRGSWPWTAALKHNGGFNCGGTLIANQWVVTAAHCVDQGKQFPQEFSVVLGDHDLTKNDGSEQEIKVERIIAHQHWNPDPTKINYDIALLKLQRPARLGRYVKTACLPTREPPVGSKCYITGWGKTKLDAGSHPILQQGILPVVSRQQCDAKNRANIGVGITDAMICGGDGGLSRLSGCHGDSGGPYVCHFDGRWELHGAVSHGAETCSSNDSYTVFANIYYLKSWIERTMMGQ